MVLADVKVKDFWAILGVNWGYVLDENGENTWLNGVVPAWKIIDLLEGTILKKQHEEHERAFHKKITDHRDSSGVEQAFAGESGPPANGVPQGQRWDDLFHNGPRASEDFMVEREQPSAEQREPL
jgi:hypothetical protein